jgi:hypothetical protein
MLVKENPARDSLFFINGFIKYSIFRGFVELINVLKLLHFIYWIIEKYSFKFFVDIGN